MQSSLIFLTLLASQFIIFLTALCFLCEVTSYYIIYNYISIIYMNNIRNNFTKTLQIEVITVWVTCKIFVKKIPVNTFDCQ